MTLLAFATLLAALGCGLIGGLFFAFSTFVMTALGNRPPTEGMAVMVEINRVILRSLFMPVFFGTALCCLALAVHAFTNRGPAAPWLIGGALAYLFGTIGVTMIWNVPLNNRLDRADPAADNAALWRRYLDRWTFWNHVRTAAALVGSGLFIGALVA
jgi:uncharacterized membrane protein